MAEPTTTPEDKQTFDDPASHNAEVIRKQAAQDISGQSTSPVENLEANSALDALAQKVSEDKEKAKAEPPVVDPKPEDEAAKKAAADQAAKDEAAKKVADEEQKRANDMFKDSPSLPPGASPKSSEAFAAIKVKAAQEISSRETKIAELTKKLEEATQKLANPIPEDMSKELEGLREFRAKLDVEASPEFKKFSQKVSSDQEFIYAQLRKSSAVDDSVIEQIKKHGGPEMVNLEKLFEKINDPTMKRIVEAKVADIEQAKWQRDQAIQSAKANIKQYVEERSREMEHSVTAHRTETKTHVDEIAKKLTWLSEKADTDKDTPEQKAANADHNKFVKETREQMEASLQDDSPQMRGIMIAGMAQLLYVQRLYEAEKAAHGKQVEALNAQIAELNSKLERFTKASVSRLRESGAPTGGATTPAPKKDDFTKPAGQALDDIMKDVMEKRAKASANG